MMRLFAIATALLFLSMSVGGSAGEVFPGHRVEKTTEPVSAEVMLFIDEPANGTYLTGRNDTEPGTIVLMNGAMMANSSMDFRLKDGLSADLNFTDGAAAEVFLTLQASRRSLPARIGAEIGSAEGNRSCGKAEETVVLSSDPTEQRLSVPLTVTTLEEANGLMLRINVAYLGLSADITLLYGGDNRSRVLLPVENYAWAHLEVKVDSTKFTVECSQYIHSPFSTTFAMIWKGHVNITGPSQPRSLIYAGADWSIAWSYGKDRASKGKYTYTVSYDIPYVDAYQVTQDFDITRTPEDNDFASSLGIWVAGAILFAIVVSVVLLFVIKRRRKKRGDG